jgi:hypothetical protein
MRFVMVMQTWMVAIASAGRDVSRSRAAAARARLCIRIVWMCTGFAATTAYSAATKNPFSAINNGTAASESVCDMIRKGLTDVRFRHKR